MSLEEDLKALQEALPHLPDEVNELGQAAHDLQQASLTALEQAGTSRQELETVLTHVRNTIPGFKVLAETLEHRLEQAVDEVDKAWTEGDGHLDEGDEGLGTAAGHVDGACTDLASALFEAATKVDQASAEGDAVTGRIVSIAHEGRDRVHAAAEAVTAQLNTLRGVLEHTRAAFESSGEALLDRFKQFKDNAAFDTGVLLDEVMHREEKYMAHLDEVGKEISAQTDPMVIELARRVDGDVTRPVTLASESFRVAVEAMAADASTHQDTVVKTREELEQAIGALKASAAPLPEAIQQIHQAARTLSSH